MELIEAFQIISEYLISMGTTLTFQFKDGKTYILEAREVKTDE